jgi:hypothetical protein
MSLIYPARFLEQSEFNLHYKFIYKAGTGIISINLPLISVSTNLDHFNPSP